MAETTKKDFVLKYQNAAIAASVGSKILPGTILTVAALESGYGKSSLSSKYNNFFGRKPEKGYKGKIVNLDTAEFIDGKRVIVKQPFKAYSTPEEGFRDYVKLIGSAQRYKDVLKQTTVKEQFEQLQKAGYATDPKYSSKLGSMWDSLQSFFTPGNTVGLVLGLGLVFFLINNSRS